MLLYSHFSAFCNSNKFNFFRRSTSSPTPPTPPPSILDSLSATPPPKLAAPFQQEHFSVIKFCTKLSSQPREINFCHCLFKSEIIIIKIDENKTFFYILIFCFSCFFSLKFWIVGGFWTPVNMEKVVGVLWQILIVWTSKFGGCYESTGATWRGNVKVKGGGRLPAI